MARYVYVLALFIYIIDILLYLSSSITSSSYNFTFVCRLLHYFPLREFFAHGGVLCIQHLRSLLLFIRPGARPPETIIGGRRHTLTDRVAPSLLQVNHLRSYLL